MILHKIKKTSLAKTLPVFKFLIINKSIISFFIALVQIPFFVKYLTKSSLKYIRVNVDISFLFLYSIK